MHSEAFARLPEPRGRPTTAPFKLRKLVTGQVLVREGDPPGSIFVVCAGRLRVYRRDLTAIDRFIEVSLVGVGGVIGELSSILDQPRSATVQAVESTQVLEIPPEALPNLVEHHPSLMRVIAEALRERSSLPDAEIAEMAARAGLVLPSEVPLPPIRRAATATPTAATGTSQPMVVPAHEVAVVYPKTVDCPSCGTRFAALTVRPRFDQPAQRDSDFHASFRSSFNPYNYEVWVCPNDLYAALPADFADLADPHRLQVAPTVEDVVESWGDELPDFNTDRTLHLRERGLELALALYQMRELPQVRIAAIAHRLAWCARERNDIDVENVWLGRALEAYRTAYEQDNLGGAKEELRIQYLCGELCGRLGDAAAAARWFTQALRHPSLKEHVTWERMLRERLANLAERRRLSTP